MIELERNSLIEHVLRGYKQEIGKDFSVYRNHVYRVYYLAATLDSDSENRYKYAIAAIFHDLGIWTHSFDYLEPSIELAKEFLIKRNREKWMEEISLMIDNHHKISPYRGDYQTTVENFRQADWADVVNGIKLFGIKKNDFKKVKQTFPSKGFHRFLIRQSTHYFLRHPFNPLPMFKK